jgi:hypothetical protein
VEILICLGGALGFILFDFLFLHIFFSKNHKKDEKDDEEKK